MSRSDLTDRFLGFSFLFYLEFSTEPETGTCHLILHLSADETFPRAAIRAEFSNVRNLFVRDIGGGITQLGFLLVEDISDSQLDRVNYSVKEMERDAMSFLCQRIGVTDLE